MGNTINSSHTYGPHTSNNDAICTADGTMTADCYFCEATDTIADSGSALGHDEVPHTAQAATCTEIGWNAYETCSRCDYTTYEEIAALEGCTVMPVKRSIDRAVEKIKRFLKNGG